MAPSGGAALLALFCNVSFLVKRCFGDVGRWRQLLWTKELSWKKNSFLLEVLTESQGGSSLAREMQCCDWTGLNLVTYTRETERRGGVAPGRKTEAPAPEGKWTQGRQDCCRDC